MNRLVCGLIVFISLSASACNRNLPHRTATPAGVNSEDHVAAKKQFLDLVKNGRQTQIDQALAKRCFLRGDLVANYTELFDTAHVRGQGYYRWNLGEIGDGVTQAESIALFVYTGSYPEAILGVEELWADS